MFLDVFVHSRGLICLCTLDVLVHSREGCTLESRGSSCLVLLQQLNSSNGSIGAPNMEQLSETVVLIHVQYYYSFRVKKGKDERNAFQKM